jgi:P-type Cu2+ transporter
MTLSTINVSDMHCGNCVGKIERALKGFADVTATYVNPARRLVLVEHGAQTDPIQLLQRIEAAGFRPSLTRVEAGNSAQRQMLKRLGIAGLAMMQVMMFALALYAGAFVGMDEADRRLFEFASLAFCIPVVGYSAMPFFTSALKSLRTGLNMDVPISLAIFFAFVVSLLNTLSGTGEVYYDSVVMFAFLLLGARYVDDRLKARFEDANLTLSALPERALVIADDGSMTPVPLAAIVPGTRIWVEQGNQLPLDGDIAAGEVALDESALTGESVPVRRGIGERAFAGTMNRGAGFELITTAVVDQTRIATIADLASRAQADKPAAARLADRIARRFVPGVLLLAAVTWLGWQWADPSQAFVAMLTVLVVSCPCALSLATPATVTAAMTWLRQNGVVLTRSDPLEQMANIDAAIFDKTGTLTVHDPVLTRIDWLDDPGDGLTRDELTAVAAALELRANHPLARAFRELASNATAVSEVAVVTGAGIEGRYRSHAVRVGHARFCGSDDPDQHAVFMSVDGLPVARFTISDPVRADAAAAIAGLQRAGIHVTMVSGDAPERCAELARELGIDFAARQAPETKLQIIRALQDQGHRVLVIGDGINDVPALAAADVSAAVLESSDLVKANADVLLLSRRLGALADLVDVSRRTRRIMRQNLWWALAYNATTMPLAAFGMLPPWVAAVGMTTSSILVMLNATRLLRPGRTIKADRQAPVPAPLLAVQGA